ncbi:hypothetical protein jhhlp_006841 [Lomentospora prolificans]|uniref:Uncharacterized protein n=1 Tax=Lomentospora prolificans TaxID=41688 RepID=A0A2N3N2W9_9PEZI|nr:hypothetical protein jhhlp_006841 [Lomentospora prolificans]
MAEEQVNTAPAIPVSEEATKVAEPPTEAKATEQQETVVPVSTSGPVSEAKKDAALNDADTNTTTAAAKAQDASAPALAADSAAPTEPTKAGAAATMNGGAKEVVAEACAPEKTEVGEQAESSKDAEQPSVPAPATTEVPKPTEETVAEEKSVEEKPTEEKVVEEKAPEEKPAETKPVEEQPTVSNGEAADVEIKDAPEAPVVPEASESQAGGKRSADEAEFTNGGEASEPVGKKAKVAEEAPATNGRALARKASKSRKEKKSIAPVGRTARRTRSQGLADV